MPIYEYACPACGTFEASCSMGGAGRPRPCPTCARRAPRILSAAHIGGPAARGRGRPRASPEPRLVQREERAPPPPTVAHSHSGRPWML